MACAQTEYEDRLEARRAAVLREPPLQGPHSDPQSLSTAANEPHLGHPMPNSQERRAIVRLRRRLPSLLFRFEAAGEELLIRLLRPVLGHVW